LALKLSHLVFIFFAIIFWFISSSYIGLLWGGILGFTFALLCFSLLFKKNHFYSFSLDSKIELIIFAIVLLATFLSVRFPLRKDYSLFVAWNDLVWNQLSFRLVLALAFPFVIGYMVYGLVAPQKMRNHVTLTTAFFVGLLIMLASFFLSDAIGISKYAAILVVGVIILLLKTVDIKTRYRKSEHIDFSMSLGALTLFIFALVLFAVVYLNPNSFVKGDLWKQTAEASNIQLSGLSEWFEMQSVGLFEYPSFFPYFLGSMADAFSLSLINLTMALAIFIPAVSVLAMLNFFSAVEGSSEGRAKWATLVWFTFSGFGMLYMLLEYGTLIPSPDLMTTMMKKLGWGSGFIYSPSLGSFAHVLRLLSLAGAVQSQSLLIRDHASLKRLLLASCILMVAIVFHPLTSILAVMFVWFAYLYTKPEVAARLGTSSVLSLGIICFLEYIFLPVSIYYNNLTVLVLCIITVVTLIIHFGGKVARIKFRIVNNAKYVLSLSLKAVLVTVVLLYITLICYVWHDFQPSHSMPGPIYWVWLVF